VAQRLSRRRLADYYVRTVEAGTPSAEVLQHIAGYLIESRRTKEMALVVRDIETVLAEHGTVTGTLTSAYALDEKTLASIKASIAERTSAKTVELYTQTDPELLGGYKITIPGKALDATIATQLTTLKTHFRKG
jgi:F0F1-type ATP synthase delta subunit